MESPLKYFAELRYPRVKRMREHLLEDILLIDIAAILSGANGWNEIEDYARCKRESRFYITSLQPDAARLNRSIRQHWGIENKLHWVLDVAFAEDLDRKRTGHAAQNHCVLNRIALNLLKQDKTCKPGIKSKRLKAGWDNDYLLHLLRN